MYFLVHCRAEVKEIVISQERAGHDGSLQRQVSAESGDSEDSSRFLHLQPTRLDFRVCRLREQEWTPSAGDAGAVIAGRRELLASLAPLADTAHPSLEFWRLFSDSVKAVSVADDEAKCDRCWQQRAVHLFPYALPRSQEAQ